MPSSLFQLDDIPNNPWVLPLLLLRSAVNESNTPDLPPRRLQLPADTLDRVLKACGTSCQVDNELQVVPIIKGCKFYVQRPLQRIVGLLKSSECILHPANGKFPVLIHLRARVPKESLETALALRAAQNEQKIGVYPLKSCPEYAGAQTHRRDEHRTLFLLLVHVSLLSPSELPPVALIFRERQCRLFPPTAASRKQGANRRSRKM